jgi:hypothetical protein
MVPAPSSSSGGADGNIEINDEMEGADQTGERADQPEHDMRALDEEVDDPYLDYHDCTRNSQCTPYELCVGGTCEDRTDVRDAGGFGFGSAIGFYGLGVTYCSVAPIIWSLAGYDSYYDYYDDYSSAGYYWEVYIANGPQKSSVVIPGLCVQFPVLKQRRYLRELGVKNLPVGLFTAGWVLYGLSVASSGVNMLAFASDDQVFGVSSSIANAAILISSFTVSIAEFAQHRTLLRAAVNRASPRRRAEVNVAPYLSFTKDRVGGGLALHF